MLVLREAEEGLADEVRAPKDDASPRRVVLDDGALQATKHRSHRGQQGEDGPDDAYELELLLDT